MALRLRAASDFANCVTVSICNYRRTKCILVNMEDMPDTELPLDAQLLLLRLDLKTERLLAEVEPLVLAIANKEAMDASNELNERRLYETHYS